MRSSFLLRLVTVILLGLFSGEMLFITVSLLPYWNSLSPEAYLENFRALAPFIGQKMLPMLIFSILAPGLCAYVDKRSRKNWLIVFALVFLIVPLYILIHGPINSWLLDPHTLPAADIVKARATWTTWHWVRMVLGLAAFALSVLNSYSELEETAMAQA